MNLSRVPPIINHLHDNFLTTLSGSVGQFSDSIGNQGRCIRVNPKIRTQEYLVFGSSYTVCKMSTKIWQGCDYGQWDNSCTSHQGRRNHPRGWTFIQRANCAMVNLLISDESVFSPSQALKFESGRCIFTFRNNSLGADAAQFPQDDAFCSFSFSKAEETSSEEESTPSMDDLGCKV